MGLGFLFASPDCWKRVFVVTRKKGEDRGRFAIFIACATAPFLVLIPLARLLGVVPDGVIRPSAVWQGIHVTDLVYLGTALGLFASFLSAINGAFVLSVHVGLVLRRRGKEVPSERERFHWLGAVLLLGVFLVFSALKSMQNPYVLANLLLGPYGIMSGILLASRGDVERLRHGAVLWLVVGAFACWFLYVVSHVDPAGAPNTQQINTVPAGAGLFVATALITRVAMAMRQSRG